MIRKIVLLMMCCTLLIGCGKNTVTQADDNSTQMGDTTQDTNNQEQEGQENESGDVQEDNGGQSDANDNKPNPDDYIFVAEGVTTQMLSADFWIDKYPDADKLILSAEDIRKWNERYAEDLEERWFGFYDFDEDDEPASVALSELKQVIEGSFIQPSGTVYDENGDVITDMRFKTLKVNQNILGLAEKNQIRYGVTVERTDIRMLPYEGIATTEKGNLKHCELQESIILMNEPVMILHTSQDREWYYILCSYAKGWVKAETVAFCEDKDAWNEMRNTEEFLVVTGDKVILEVDNYSSVTSELVLYMGTKCKLVKAQDYTGTGTERLPYECYIIEVPARDAAGKLYYEYAFVPVSRDVNVGYLDYTAENMLVQLFKVNGDRYGWGGMHNARDCSQYAMDVYRCFGINIGRNSGDQATMPTTTYDMESMGIDEKKAVYEQLLPGAIVYFPGHIMLYLGEHEGEYYVISATGGLIPPTSESGEIVSVQTCLITTLSTKRASGKTWFESVTKIKVF